MQYLRFLALARVLHSSPHCLINALITWNVPFNFLVLYVTLIIPAPKAVQTQVLWDQSVWMGEEEADCVSV